MKIRVCTYNIRCDNKGDGINCFDGRKSLIAREFPKYEADVVGFQEVLPHQREWLVHNLKGYTVVGTGRNADRLGEHVCIAYRTDTFELAALDTFWLSDTPRIPGTRFNTDQSRCPRICTTAILLTKPKKDSAPKILRVYNTHLDHVALLSQAQGMTVVLERIAADDAIYPDTPVVITGDFNVRPDSPVVASVNGACSCGKPIKDATAEVGGTFHAWGKREPIKIDYIFTTASYETASAKKLTDTEDGVYLSDHYPVLTEIEV